MLVLRLLENVVEFDRLLIKQVIDVFLQLLLGILLSNLLLAPVLLL